MRKYLIAGLVLFAVTWAVSSFAAERAALFAQANARYAAGDFKTAANIYQEILNSKKATAAVYYNLANTELRLGKKGSALLNYERAIKAAPRDKDLRWNLSLLKNSLPDGTEEAQMNFAAASLKKAADLFSADELGMALAAALGLLALFAALRFVSAFRTTFFQFLIWLVVVAAAVLFIFKWTQLKDPHVVILQPEVYAHYGPSDKETKAFLLHEGAEGKVMDESKGWLYIVLENKNTGWIPKESCEVI